MAVLLGIIKVETKHGIVVAHELCPYCKLPKLYECPHKSVEVVANHRSCTHYHWFLVEVFFIEKLVSKLSFISLTKIRG